MGPSLAVLAKKAAIRPVFKKILLQYQRFSEEGVIAELNENGVETIVADLMEDRDAR